MSKNDITGDNIITNAPSEKFSAGWDTIWGKKKKEDIQKILEQPSTLIPQGLSLEEMHSFIVNNTQ